MSKLSKQQQDEMIQCIEHLLEIGINLYGTKLPFSLNRIAAHLVSSGCRINVGKRRQKWLKGNNKI